MRSASTPRARARRASPAIARVRPGVLRAHTSDTDEIHASARGRLARQHSTYHPGWSIGWAKSYCGPRRTQFIIRASDRVSSARIMSPYVFADDESGRQDIAAHLLRSTALSLKFCGGRGGLREPRLLLFVVSVVMVSRVHAVCVEYDHSTCPQCQCCPTYCRAPWVQLNTGCTSTIAPSATNRYRYGGDISSCSETLCDSGCGMGCTRNCNNGNYLPQTASSSSPTCADQPLRYINRRCYEDRLCKTIDDNGVCVCAADFRVQDNECVACPAGSTNEAEDDPRGDDTYCTTCAENYYVAADSTCTACPGSSTRDAGDDIRAGITTCNCGSFTPAANVDISGSTCSSGTLDVGQMCASLNCVSNAYDLMGGGISCDVNGVISNSAVCLRHCDASGPIDRGDGSTCSSTLPSGSSCSPTCDNGYSPSGSRDCNDGVLTDTSVCSADPCSVSSPNHGVLDDCLGSIPSGTSCSFACFDGYSLSGPTSCAAGTLTPGTCDPILCEEDQFVDGHVCKPCPGGTYNPAGDDASGANTECTPNPCSVSSPDHGTLGNCPAGSMLSGSSCTFACSLGYALSGTTSCSYGLLTQGTCNPIFCQEDQFVDGNVCKPCPPGTINSQGDDASGANTQCDNVICGVGEKVVSHSCVPCELGATNSGGGHDASGDDTTCAPTLCLADERVQDNACVVCDPGESNTAGDSAVGADTICDGEKCAQNQRVQDGSCVVCEPGTTNVGGDDNLGPNTACDTTFCGVNQRVVSNVCVSCPTGTNNTIGGHDASGADTTCNAVSCGANEHVLSNSCVACPGDSKNVAGDDASLEDTTCSCAFNEYVSSNTCIPCSNGWTRQGGDEVPGEDTSCVAITCATNERVSSNACVVCPSGSTNAEGDDASGGNTTCACGIDEHVIDDVCVVCPEGSTRAAGDPVPGPDTECAWTPPPSPNELHDENATDALALPPPPPVLPVELVRDDSNFALRLMKPATLIAIIAITFA